jgi:hypothetical protein
MPVAKPLLYLRVLDETLRQGRDLGRALNLEFTGPFRSA